MARTWSVRLRGIITLVDRAKQILPKEADRGFLGLAVLAHLCISLLGAVALGAQIARAEDLGFTLFRPSVVLFLLAGAITALLLLHMSAAVALEPGAPLRTPHQPGHILAAAPSPTGTHAFSGLMDRVGHDLRTPLNAIIGFSELLQHELQGPLGSPRYQEYVRHIRDSGLALLKAAEDTMALTALLAERSRLHNEVIDLDNLIDDICASPEARAHGIRIVCGSRCAAKVRGEHAALRQSLASLLAAAMLRAPDRRPISVSASTVDAGVRLCVSFMDGAPPAAMHNAASRPSFAVTRMLLQLQEIPLQEHRGGDGIRHMAVLLPLAGTGLRPVPGRSSLAPMRPLAA